MENIIVQENSSYKFGGGIFQHAGVTTISNTKITDNNALTKHGGGIAVFVGGALLNNVEISNNIAEHLGGGAAFYLSEVDLINTTVVNNIDHANNSAIWSNSSTVGIVNSIVWGNQPNRLEDAYTITHSNIPSNTQIFGEGQGNIDTDPLFTDSENGDFTLSQGSPCIDAGTADIDGDGVDDITDFNGLAPDMGAFEAEWLDLSDVDQFPESYTVHQNYPNPFNPTTTLRYDLPEDAMVTIAIYDLMGRSIRLLVNSRQTAGYRSIQWNATNDAGSPVSAGLYIYTIQAGEFRQTKKMVLLK
jgi:hypothetical protein